MPPREGRRPVDDTWKRSEEGWRAHVAAMTSDFAIRGSARNNGSALGYGYLALLARRLVQVTPADRDGARLTLASAWGRVEGWWRQSQVAAAEGARRAAGVV